MDVGMGLAVCGVSFSAVAVFYRIIPRKDCGSADHCQDHSGVMKSIENMNSWLSKIDQKMDKLLGLNGRGQ